MTIKALTPFSEGNVQSSGYVLSGSRIVLSRIDFGYNFLHFPISNHSDKGFTLPHGPCTMFFNTI